MLSRRPCRALLAGKLVGTPPSLSYTTSLLPTASSSQAQVHSACRAADGCSSPHFPRVGSRRFATSVPKAEIIDSATTSSAQTDPAAVPPLREDILRLAEKPRTGVSMMGMYRMGATSVTNAKLMGAQFLHNELAIRLARSLKQLHDLPYGAFRML